MDTSQSVCAVFMINQQSGLSSCNYHERFLFAGPKSQREKKITFGLEESKSCEIHVQPSAERHSLCAVARRVHCMCASSSFFFSVPQTPLGGSSRNAKKLFAFLKAKPAKQTPLSHPSPTPRHLCVFTPGARSC